MDVAVENFYDFGCDFYFLWSFCIPVFATFVTVIQNAFLTQNINKQINK